MGVDGSLEVGKNRNMKHKKWTFCIGVGGNLLNNTDQPRSKGDNFSPAPPRWLMVDPFNGLPQPEKIGRLGSDIQIYLERRDYRKTCEPINTPPKTSLAIVCPYTTDSMMSFKVYIHKMVLIATLWEDQSPWTTWKIEFLYNWPGRHVYGVISFYYGHI